MSKIGLILEELISEISASQIRDKYYSDIDKPTFNRIVKADPKTKGLTHTSGNEIAVDS